jgi:hypothetical protein
VKVNVNDGHHLARRLTPNARRSSTPRCGVMRRSATPRQISDILAEAELSTRAFYATSSRRTTC